MVKKVFSCVGVELTIFQFCLFPLVLNTTEKILAPSSAFPLSKCLYVLVRFPLSLLKAEQSQLSQFFFKIGWLQPFNHLCDTSLSSLQWALCLLPWGGHDWTHQSRIVSPMLSTGEGKPPSILATLCLKAVVLCHEGMFQMQLQQGVHQDSQIIFTKLFSRWLALHQPHQKLGFPVVPADPGEDPADLFLLLSGAVQGADLVSATPCGGTDPSAACGQSPSPTKTSQTCRDHSPWGAWSEGRSLMY